MNHWNQFNDIILKTLMFFFLYACQKLMHQIFYITADHFGLGEENGDEGEDEINEIMDCPCNAGIQKFFKSADINL